MLVNSSRRVPFLLFILRIISNILVFPSEVWFQCNVYTFHVLRLLDLLIIRKRWRRAFLCEVDLSHFRSEGPALSLEKSASKLCSKVGIVRWLGVFLMCIYKKVIHVHEVLNWVFSVLYDAIEPYDGAI